MPENSSVRSILAPPDTAALWRFNQQTARCFHNKLPALPKPCVVIPPSFECRSDLITEDVLPACEHRTLARNLTETAFVGVIVIARSSDASISDGKPIAVRCLVRGIIAVETDHKVGHLHQVRAVAKRS